MTSPGIGAASVMGIAFEATPGTYVAPTKFFPFLSETLKYIQGNDYRRPIRATAAIIGAIAGDSHVEGDITMEVLSDVLPYFLYASRATVVKSGTGPYVYVATPNANAIASSGRTLSVTLVRNGVVFAYTGCVVSQHQHSVQGGILQVQYSIVGIDEAVQSAPTATWPVSSPFGAGQYSLQIPTASQVFDSDSFEFTVNDNATPQYRLRSAGRQPGFINWGESEATLKVDRDFTSRTDYDAFKALTSQTVTMLASKGASESVAYLMPVGFKDTFETVIGGEGDLVRSTINYQAAIDGTGKHYLITVTTPTESIT